MWYACAWFASYVKSLFLCRCRCRFVSFRFHCCCFFIQILTLVYCCMLCALCVCVYVCIYIFLLFLFFPIQCSAFGWLCVCVFVCAYCSIPIIIRRWIFESVSESYEKWKRTLFCVCSQWVCELRECNKKLISRHFIDKLNQKKSKNLFKISVNPLNEHENKSNKSFLVERKWTIYRQNKR